MSGAGNPLSYDYRDPRHVGRYGKLVVRGGLADVIGDREDNDSGEDA